MLTLRVSEDHFDPKIHKQDGGADSGQPMIHGLRGLQQNALTFHIAGRTRWDKSEAALRRGYQQLFSMPGLNVDAQDSQALVLFPEMDPAQRYRRSPQPAGAFWMWTQII